MRRLALFLLLVSSVAAFGDDSVPWFEKTLIGMEVGPTGAQWGSDLKDVGYSSRFDGAEIVAKQIELGSEYLVLWARDGEWAYYDSKLAAKVPGLGARDPLREAVDAAKPHKLPIIAYCVVQGGGRALREHPEWEMVGADGKPIPGRLCLNSPYRDYVHGLLEEMLAYGLDGFHVDMVDQGFGPPYGCYCEHCKKAFTEKFATGETIPSGGVDWSEGWDQMLEFRYFTSDSFERDTMAFVKSRAPQVTVDFNYHGYPPFSFEVGQRPVQHAGIGDFVTCESGVWGFSALAAGLTTEFVRAATPGRRYQVVMQRGARFYHDQTTRPTNDMRWEMFALLMHGAQVTIVDKTPFEGQIDPVAYGRMAEVFKEVNAKREHFGQPQVYDVGIMYSARSRDWYGREQPYKYMTAFNGAHKALAYEHLTTGVLLEENLATTLKNFPVVVLPDTTIIHLGVDETQLLKEFVLGGGQLIVTGNSGCYDTFGNAQGHSDLEELIGAKLARIVPDSDNYVSFDQEPEGLRGMLDEVPLDWPHLVYGPAVVYEPTTAKPYGMLHAPIRQQGQLEGKIGVTFPSAPGEGIGPAVLVNAIGKGRVITFAVSPGAAAGGEYRTVEARKLLSNAVRAAQPEPAIKIDAPAFVETVVTKDADNVYRVHFTSYVTPPGSTDPKRPWAIPELMVDVPMFKATLRAAGAFKSARASNPDTTLDASKREVSLTINDVHEVVVLELKE
jgi:hypothetical protein